MSDVKVDTGGGANATADHYSAPGDDSHPLPGDRVALVDTQGARRRAAVAYLDTKNDQTAGPGEKRIYARDASGAAVAEVWLKSDGSIVIDNGSGTVTLKTNGDVDANGATITTTGDVTTPEGVSLRTHTHIGNLGVATGPPIPG